MAASFHVLTPGYVGERVASTVSVVVDGNHIVVIDPGMVADQSAILDPLRDLGIAPANVTDVIFSHHHPDHTLNAALFPGARFHDHWAVYHRDVWDSRAAEGFRVSPHVKLIQTPGHTAEDVTTLVETEEGIVACTHLWWNASGPPEDPLATHPKTLHAGRVRVLDLATVIVPGHGEPFRPDPNTPR
jgi:glyoxylase-like metal-dependent hydrolase (beta-lactamase superfamily II)